MNKKDKILKIQNAIIITLADLIEKRDHNTSIHVEKTASYVMLIVSELMKKGYFKDELTGEFLENLVYAAQLHDIGKIAIPDSILNKPSKLSKSEFMKMQTHTIIGGQIIQDIVDKYAFDDKEFLKVVKDVVLYHHEKWDGTGYPYGLKGEDIPLSARIIAVADVFDALSSKRIYKDSICVDDCIRIIKDEAGSHFDPLIVDAFLSALGREYFLKRKVRKN